MDKYPNARNYFAGQVWAIQPETLEAISDILSMRASGVELTEQEIAARISGGPGRGSMNTVGSIMVLPLYGVIDQKVNAMSAISGGTSVNQFMEGFRTALNDKTVSAIIIDVDSPGGSVAGIPEAASEIYAARGKKPIIAVANPRSASAAYWLACAADELVCMQSGQVGSVGVFTVHNDISKANEMNGRKPTYIKYGAYKTEANPDEPLTEDAQAYMQAQVNQMGDMFVKFVAKARGVSVDTVRSSFGQGRMLMAKDAMAAGMIDSIGTIEQTIGRLSKGTQTAAMALAQSTDELRADTGDDEEDGDEMPMECSCTCAEDCTCNGANDTCCGNPGCECCSDTGKMDAQEVSMGEATNGVLVGLRDIATRWGDLVDRGIANGKRPGAVLTNAKNEALTAFEACLRETHEQVAGIMQRAGTPQTVDTKAALEHEINRLRLLDVRKRNR